jgi:hypothetical protein
VAVYNENCRRKSDFDAYPSSITPTLHEDKRIFKILFEVRYRVKDFWLCHVRDKGNCFGQPTLLVLDLGD